jgi:hypothetical protein
MKRELPVALWHEEKPVQLAGQLFAAEHGGKPLGLGHARYQIKVALQTHVGVVAKLAPERDTLAEDIERLIRPEFRCMVTTWLDSITRRCVPPEEGP